MKTPDQLVTASDFLEFFEAIPEEKWCCGDFSNGCGAHCARGHLGEEECHDDGFYPIQVRRMATALEMEPWHLADLNDGIFPEYKQPTPKARICAALRDAIAQGK